MINKVWPRLQHTYQNFFLFFCTKTAKYSGECVEKSFIVVVCDAAAILDLTEHVPDGVPRHALHIHARF